MTYAMISGHLDKKIKGQEEKIKSWVTEKLRELHPDKLYTGMAPGTDQIAAVAAKQMGIPLVCCFPYPRTHYTEREAWLMADETVYFMGPDYTKDCYRETDRYMLVFCDVLLCVWDGEANYDSETYWVREHAIKKGLRVIDYEWDPPAASPQKQEKEDKRCAGPVQAISSTAPPQHHYVNKLKLSKEDKENLVNSLTQKDIDELTDLLNAATLRTMYQDVKTKVDSYEFYVGRCYKKFTDADAAMKPQMWRYYKVIGNRSRVSHAVSALTFDETPFYWFDYKRGRVDTVGNYFLGEYTFEGIEIEEVPVMYLKNDGSGGMKEITLEEYDAALDNYISKLKEMKWPADHYRWGGITPFDIQWGRS